MELPPVTPRNDAPEGFGEEPGSQLSDMLSDLLGTEGVSPAGPAPEAAEVPDPVELAVASPLAEPALAGVSDPLGLEVVAPPEPKRAEVPNPVELSVVSPLMRELAGFSDSVELRVVSPLPEAAEVSDPAELEVAAPQAAEPAWVPDPVELDAVSPLMRELAGLSDSVELRVVSPLPEAAEVSDPVELEVAAPQAGEPAWVPDPVELDAVSPVPVSEPAEVSDSVELEVNSTPLPVPASPRLPVSVVLDDLLHELISNPLRNLNRDSETTAQGDLAVSYEEPAEPSAELAPYDTGEAAEAAAALAAFAAETAELAGEPAIVEPVDEQWEVPESELEPCADPPIAAGEAEIEALIENLETAAGGEVEIEASSTQEPDSMALDALVADIDQQTEEAFRDDREFAFEGELPAKETRGSDSCIVFLLDGTPYAIPIRNVLEMDTLPRTTLVPNVPSFVRGVTNVRGEIISVIDLRSLLGMERWEFAERGRILIVRTADQHTAALAVDEVRGTASLSLKELGAPTGPIQDKVMPVLLGVGEHQEQVLNVLDIDKLFRMQEIQQLTEN